MSTYSSNLYIELIGTGEQTGTWGSTTNNNFQYVFEEAIVGRATVAFSDADVTLTPVAATTNQTFRNVYLNCTGTNTASRNLIVPTINKNYIVENNTTGGFNIVVKTSAGTGITVPNGYKCAVYVDGTNVVTAFNYLGGTTTFSTLAVTGNATIGGTLGVGAAPASGYSVDITSVAASNNVLVRAKNTIASEDVGFNISGNYSGTQYEYSIGMNNGANGAALNFWGPASASGSYDFYMNSTLMSSQTLSALTLKQNLLFSADATYNIGASGATRPNNIYVANGVTAGGQVASITSTQLINFLAQCSQSSGYASLRLYNDQNSSVRALEIDYLGTTSTSGLTGGPTGEQGLITTTGAYPLMLGTANAARMWFSGTSTAVGIGRTPTTIFDVYGTQPTMTLAASNNNSRSLYSATGYTSGGTGVVTIFGSLGDGGGYGSLYTTTNHSLTFATNNASPQMALTTSGNLAISSVSPHTYASTPRLYIDAVTTNAASITLNQLNTSGGYNGQLLWQGYYNGTTTTHDSMAIKRYNGVDDNTSAYRVYMDFMLRPPGVSQPLAIAARLTNINGGCLIVGNSSATNLYDSTLYAYKSASNITNGQQEANAVATFGSNETSSNASVFIGADQGTNKYGYIGVLQRGIGYLPLLINPAGGNVGIGTGVSMPSNTLDIWAAGPNLRLKATSSAGGATLSLDCGTTAGYSNQIGFLVNGTTYWALGGKDIGTASGNQLSIYNYNTSSNAFTIDTATNQTSINSGSVGTAMLYVNTGGYAMTSGQSGAFILATGTGRPCIEVASQSNGQDAAFRTVVYNGSTWSGWTVGVNIETGSDTLSWMYNNGLSSKIYGPSGTVYMRLTTGGALSTTTGSLGTISDIRMKKNVADATNKLDQLMQLRVVNYTLIDDPQERKMLGFVAQEVEQVFPGLVEEYDVRDPETKEITMMQKTVKTTVLIPMLVKAMQELKAEFDAYKASHP